MKSSVVRVAGYGIELSAQRENQFTEISLAHLVGGQAARSPS